jgi:transcriptional regulator with XRE-family HTH domain
MAGSRLTALVGSTLLRERERRRFTQHQLAVMAGVSQGTIARIERGDRHASLPMVERLFAALGMQLPLGVESLDAQVDAEITALLQGAPVPAEAVHVALAWGDADAITVWLKKNHAQRWHARWEVFGYLHVDPRDPGDHRWRTIPGEIRARMCDVLPPSIRVEVGDRKYLVVPLVDLAIGDPTIARLLDRYRRRATS